MAKKSAAKTTVKATPAKAAARPAVTTTKVTTAKAKKTPKQLFDVILIAVCLALSVTVAVLSVSRAIDSHYSIVLLSVGLACLSVYVLDHATHR